MPIYEFWCPECKAKFKKLRPFGSKDTEVKCPGCNSGVRRMLSVVAAVGRGNDDGYASGGGGGCACGGHCGCGGP